MPAVGTRVRYDNLWDEKRGCRKAFEVVLLETAEPAPKDGSVFACSPVLADAVSRDHSRSW